MNRNNGLLAGMLAILTVLGVSNLPNKSSSSRAGEEAKSSTSPLPKTMRISKRGPSSPCMEIAKRLQRFMSEDAGSIHTWPLPDSCYEPEEDRSGTKPMEAPELYFAIATVPDPISTHLSLSFDRIVESIQQAAQDNNYSYDASWFPWEAADKDYPLFDDQREAEKRQDIQQAQPGMLVFRRALHASGNPHGGGLVVFLVGEQPTGGIRDEQFENALDWIAKLGGLEKNRVLRILGPAFSGSLPSLRLALERYRLHSLASIFVSSGTVSSPRGPSWFDTWIEDFRPGSYFRTAMESDSVVLNRFCQYLNNQGYPLDRVAFLSEDETAFGKSFTDSKKPGKGAPCDGVIDLYYPRDIVTLRSAYQQQSILNGAKSSSNSAPSTTLRSDLSEPANNNHDTVRSYGGQLTPLAQEAILLDIVNRLNEREIQFVVLRSTNSLDRIFLCQFLRRSYPEGRVVIDGADLLFARGAEGRSLRGVMTLSTYPLLPEQQDWTSTLITERNGGYRTFEDDTMEGVYIAARELLRDPQLGSEVPIHDYAPPAWALAPRNGSTENERPPTWLSVIGHRQFWPLAVLNSDTMPNQDSEALAGKLQPSPDRGDGLPISIGTNNPLYFPTAMWTLLIACAGWSIFHFYLCWKGSIMGSLRALTYFAPIDRRQHSALIALSGVLLAILAVSVAEKSGIFSLFHWVNLFEDSGRLTGLEVALIAVALILVPIPFALAAYWFNSRISPLHASVSPSYNTKDWRRNVFAGAVLTFLALLGFQVYLFRGLTQANAIPMYWRSVHLFSGVSPLLPQALLLIGAYLWCWCSLRGIAHFGDDRPLLPKLEDLPELEVNRSRMPMFSRKVAGTPTEDKAIPLTMGYMGRMLLMFVITVGAAWIALQGPWLRTLGERKFGLYIFSWVCLSISVILADGIQTWRAWSALRRLLVFLDRLPLRRTIRSLNGLGWGSVWKMGGNVLEERYRWITFQAECFRHLKNSVTAWLPDNRLDEIHKSMLAVNISTLETKLADFRRWFIKLETDKPVEGLRELHDFQEELAAMAGALMTHILIPAWDKEKRSLILGRSDIGKPGEDGKAGIEIPTDELEPHVRVAEEFFVLPYLAFIQNILGRLRTIALGILWLFVGATLAVSSYPFDPLNVLGAIFLTVFTAVGGLTVVVYSQMSRDATLSHITNTKPGELGIEFWVRLLGFGVGPLIALLTTLFPSITDFALSWLQPGIEALK